MDEPRLSRASALPAALAVARAPLCALTRTRLPVSVCDDLNEQNALTRAGVDAAPTNVKLKLNQPYTYIYSIGAKDSAVDVKRNAGGDAAPVQSGKVAFGKFNYARLTGDGTIKIESLDAEVQDTTDHPTPVWRWKLTGTEPGARTLTLDTGVELRPDNGAPVRLGQNAKRIDVSVTVSGMDKIARMAKDADTVMGISTDLLKQLGVLFGAAGAAYAAFLALRGRGKGDAKA